MVERDNLAEKTETAREAGQWSPEGCEPADWGETSWENYIPREEPQGTAAGLRYQTVRHYL